MYSKRDHSRKILRLPVNSRQLRIAYILQSLARIWVKTQRCLDIDAYMVHVSSLCTAYTPLLRRRAHQIMAYNAVPWNARRRFTWSRDYTNAIASERFTPRWLSFLARELLGRSVTHKTSCDNTRVDTVVPRACPHSIPSGNEREWTRRRGECVWMFHSFLQSDPPPSPPVDLMKIRVCLRHPHILPHGVISYKRSFIIRESTYCACARSRAVNFILHSRAAAINAIHTACAAALVLEWSDLNRIM